jgi:DNA excision repair protein ERCC-5
MGHTNVGKGSTSNEEPPDFPEHLFDNDRLQSSIGPSEDFPETIGADDNISSLVGGSDDICEGSDHGSKETIEISFVDDQIGAKDNDDELFLHLVSGTSSSVFADDDRLAKNAEESDNSEDIWEEGVIEEELLPKKVGDKDYHSSPPDNCFADDEVEWEEGGFDVPDVPSSSEYNQFKLPRGDIEEEALIQEAIKRSLEDSEKQEFENGVPKDLQTSVEDKPLQSYGDVPEPSEAPGTTYYNSETSFCKETIKELGVGSNAGEDGLMHDPEVLEADGQENKNQAQRESNDGQTGTDRDYSPGSLPPYNVSTSTPAARPSPSSKDNDISAPRTGEWPKEDSDEVIKHNTSNSHKSECNTNDPYIGETSKAPQKELLMDELVANTAIQKENVVQEDINIIKLSENYDSHIISENNLQEEISFLRQEQVDLGNERRKFESHAESVSSEMFAECQVC